MKTLSENKSTLTQHQQQVFDTIVQTIDTKVSGILRSEKFEDYLLSLTGAAGTGKTYLTTLIAKYLMEKQKNLAYPENLDYSFVITAPTHKAVGVLAGLLQENNINASCKTIHSFLGIKPFIDYNTGEEKFTVDKTKKSKDVTSILMVDESSMIGSELYNFILDAIGDGRVQLVLFIGDPFQLLPVSDNNNKIYKLKNQFKLSQVVRQAKDSYIIKIASRLRESIKSENYMDLREFFAQCDKEFDDISYFHNKEDFLNDFYKNEKWYQEDKIVATHQNKNVDAFNRTIRAKYWEEKGVSTPVTLLPGDRLRFKEMYSVGDITLYGNGEVTTLEKAERKLHETLKIEYWECRSVNVPEQQIFRVVDPDSLKVFNDKLTAIAKKAKASRYPDNKKYWKAFFAARDMFASVQYVHASTIHKLQGSTYETAYIDLFSLIHNSYMSMDEKYRLVYVAVTRASKDVKIFMSAFDSNGMSLSAGLSDINVAEKLAEADDILSGMRF